MDTVVGLSVWQFIIAVTTAALATFLGTFIVEVLKNRSRETKARNEYKTQLSVELEQLGKAIDRLKSEYKSTTYFPFRFIELAKKQATRVEETLKNSSILSNSDLQRKLFETVTDYTIILTEIDGLEFVLVDKSKTQAEKNALIPEVKEQRTEKNIELSDLKRRFDDITKEI
jgi:hypothetical protein